MDHKRVLVVEDDKLSRLALRQVLERLGYQVVDVGDGLAAVDAAATAHFDAIVMDCQMPQMNGFQATAVIRHCEAETQGYRTPIIGVSVRCMPGDSEAALAKGMDRYLAKPVHDRALRAALEELLPNEVGPLPVALP